MCALSGCDPRTNVYFARPWPADQVVIAVVTNERVLGFSAFAGGFFAKGLSGDETVTAMDGRMDVIVLTTDRRRLILRAQQNSWEELQ